MKNFLTGLSFAALWGSGSVATKWGLKAVQPFILINIRFFLAAIIMFFITMVIQKTRLPNKTEWLPLFVCGLLSMALYPAVFVFAMSEITPGLATLIIASCPLLISLLNLIWLRRKISTNVWLGLTIGLTGVLSATYPLLANAHATLRGVVLIFLSMICYAIGTVYYQSIDWKLPKMSINAWQILFGWLLLCPFTWLCYVPEKNSYNFDFAISVFWMVVPISIIAIQLWLYLLKAKPTKASLWLFLCPIFGYFYAAILTKEPITWYAITGTLLVIIGLYVGQMEIKSEDAS